MRSAETMPVLDLPGFDLNAAIEGALQDVVSNEDIALEEKIRRMESMVTTGNTSEYREFIDFRSMAAQMEMLCSHDHALADSMKHNETLSGFLDEHGSHDGHDHDDESSEKSKKKHKKKKRRGWFGAYLSLSED